jgi:hypothetical protein
MYSHSTLSDWMAGFDSDVTSIHAQLTYTRRKTIECEVKKAYMSSFHWFLDAELSYSYKTCVEMPAEGDAGDSSSASRSRSNIRLDVRTF